MPALRLAPMLLVLVACTAISAAACASGPAPAVRATSPPTAPASAVAETASPSPNPSPSPGPAPRTIVIDPGHGGEEIGAAYQNPATGAVLREKDSNLEMAFRLRGLLETRGYRTTLTRDADARPTPLVEETPAEGPAYTATRADLQARVDIANAARADLFVSLHSNGSSSPAESGVEVWYSSSRPFGEENHRLAELALDRVLAELRGWGYAAADRETKDDICFRFRAGRCFHLFVLGTERELRLSDVRAFTTNPAAAGTALPDEEDRIVARTRATQMPGVLVEMLFLSNGADAAVLQDDGARDAMARGLADAIDAYFGRSG